MIIRLSATIYQTGNIYTGWLDDIKGVIAQGESVNDVKVKLMKILQIKKEVENGIIAKTSHDHKNVTHEEIELQLSAS